MSYLSREDRIELSGALSKLYDLVQGSLERRNLLKNAGLDLFLSDLPLGDGVSPSRFAQALVIKLEDYGPLQVDSPYEALGMLLSYLVDLDELPASERAKFAGLIVRYDLVQDAAYIAELSERYKIGEVASKRVTGRASRKAVVPRPAESPALPPLALDTAALEQVINSKDNFLDIAQLIGAIYSARAVCLIQSPKGQARGTGFLIGPDLVLTNNHVLPRRELLPDAAARFDFVTDLNGVPSPGREFPFVTDFFHGSPPEQLDYSLIRLTAAPLPPGLTEDDRRAGTSLLDLVQRQKHRGYLLLAPRFIQQQQRVNIIQHPVSERGTMAAMKAVLTQNYVPTDMTDTRIHYLADTMGGSSGSPVFNASWEVVALHHSGGPYPPEPIADKSRKAWKGVFRVNEGIPARAILKDFQDKKLDSYLPRD
jgi:hypothetical protein